MDGRTIVSKNGRIVIPKKIRNVMGIKEGTVLELFLAKEMTLLITVVTK